MPDIYGTRSADDIVVARAGGTLSRTLSGAETDCLNAPRGCDSVTDTCRIVLRSALVGSAVSVKGSVTRSKQRPYQWR